MADQRALYESISRRGVQGARAGSAQRQRVVIFALVGILLALAVASQFFVGGSTRRPAAKAEFHSGKKPYSQLCTAFRNRVESRFSSSRK